MGAPRVGALRGAAAGVAPAINARLSGMPPPNTRTGPKCAVPDGEREGGCCKAGRGVRRSRRLAIRIGFHKFKLEK